MITAFHKAGVISDLNFYDDNKFIKAVSMAKNDE